MNSLSIFCFYIPVAILKIDSGKENLNALAFLRKKCHPTV